VPLLVRFPSTAEHVGLLESWIEKLQRTEEAISMRTPSSGPSWPEWRQRETGGWALIRHAQRGLLLHDLRMPDFHNHCGQGGLRPGAR